MCGIAGIIGAPGVEVSTHIRGMCDVIQHRGPDDEGYAVVEGSTVRFLGGTDTPEDCYVADVSYAPERSGWDRIAGHLALGHRRLSIVDLSGTGHQPMADRDRRCVLVYNGEVYNHVELRTELEALGHEFRSTSDTEVVLAAWRQWGEACLHRLNGMFAFLLVDLERMVVFAARDRFGIKPLYWWNSPTGLVAFASEIKQFTVLPGWRARLNGVRAYEFLNWGLCDHGGETLFDGVHQVPGGHYVLMDLRSVPRCAVQPRRWYTLRAAKVDLDLDSAAERFRALFDDSVKLRLRADVPVGTGLSGGLDSSSIVCTVSDLLRRKGAADFQNTFSACSDDMRFDERHYIEVVAAHTGVRTHYTFPSLADLFPSLERMIWHHDEPFLSTSVYAEWKVFELVRSCGVKVTLDGHGADELLAGYHSFFGARLAGAFRDDGWAAGIRELSAIRARSGYGTLHLLLRMMDVVLPERIRQPLRRLSGRAATGPEWLDSVRLGVEEKDPFRACGAKAAGIREMSRAQLLHTSLPVQLKWADRDSMAHSVESRVPFLDYRLVEFVLGCPDTFKIAGGWTKWILRRALADRLPREIVRRTDKMGFVTPEMAWVREHSPDEFRRAVRDAVDASMGVLTSATLKAADELIDGNRSYDGVLWRWICFGRWMSRFGVTVR